MVAEELDVPLERVQLVMGDSGRTVNMGGASAATGISRAGMNLREMAAEARRLMIDMAATSLGVAAERLTVSEGVIHDKADANRRISYAELIGGGPFDTSVKWNGQMGLGLAVTGQAKLRDPSDFKMIGKSPPRRDLPGKVFGTLEMAPDVRLPGMLHARMIRPEVAGAVPVKVNDDSIKDIPGAKAVWIKDLLADATAGVHRGAWRRGGVAACSAGAAAGAAGGWVSHRQVGRCLSGRCGRVPQRAWRNRLRRGPERDGRVPLAGGPI
jgi:nicotinate dehydrogenase subunit B